MRVSPVVFAGMLPLLLACGSEPAPDSATAALPSADTATFSAEAVQIAEFTYDTSRTVPWRAISRAPARLMLDPSSLETIGSITEGRIAQVLVRVGDRVQAGQVLVTIHSHEIMDARSRLANAISQRTATESGRTLATTALGRARRLLDARAMSRADVERAETAQVMAEAAYAQAISEYQRAEGLVHHLEGEGPAFANADPHDVLIRTPIAGVVTAREAQPGTVVLPGTPLITVGNPDRLLLQMQLGESAAAGVRVGSTVQFTLTAEPGARYNAVVTRVAPTLDTLTRTIEVIAQPSGGSGVGRAESFAQAEISGTAGAPSVVIAAGAVQAMEGDTVVLAADPRGEGIFVEAIPVRVGRRAADLVEITSGLAPGRQVIVGRAAVAKAELLKRRTGGSGE